MADEQDAQSANGDPVDDLIVDLEDPGVTVVASEPPPKLEPYNPAKDRENVRGQLAKGLVWLLALIVVVSFAILVFAPHRSDGLRELLTIVFGPITALVGAAVGYYFGSQETK